MGNLTLWILIMAASLLTLDASFAPIVYVDYLLVTVKTGDGKDADTNSNVIVVFEDDNGRLTKPFPINQLARGHLRRGGTDQHRVPIPDGFGRIVTMKLSRDNRHVISPDWFCDHIFVYDLRNNNRFYFPIDRWIEGNLVYEFNNYATCLPQVDPNDSTRLLTLQNKRKDYEFTYHLGGAMVKNLPREEFLDENYYRSFRAKEFNAVAQILALLPAVTFNDMTNIYRGEFDLPESKHFWKEDSWFGAQRVQGILPNIIELCNNIPNKLGVTEATVEGLLEGSTLQQALGNNKIFITDLEILDGIVYRNNLDHASPIALFYLNKRNQLMPIAIQLRQRKGPNNPVYTPHDPLSTWLVAKMYYNNAEAQFHQAPVHFGSTHVITDGIATSMNRQLSPSHPIFKLLKPHFIGTLAINKIAEPEVFISGKGVDLWSMGYRGFMQLSIKGLQHFTFERAIGNVESDARSRGVFDKQVLPYYPFRDDAMSMYNIIRNYVTKILTHYYDTSEKVVHSDWELQNWRAELAKPRAQGGVGIADLPGSKTGFSEVGEVIDLVTMIITQSSVGHAAVNFQQYDTYGYVPNYPAMIKEGPPTKKREYTEANIMRMLPNNRDTINIMGLTKVFSWQGANDLGDFERRYLYDPVSLKAHMELKEDLTEFSKEVKNRNRIRLFPYKYLDPDFVPNSVSI